MLFLSENIFSSAEWDMRNRSRGQESEADASNPRI
jgi:hypothetical protein